MLRNLSVALLLSMAIPTFAWARGPVHVSGYTRKDGTHVREHTRSLPHSGLSSDQSPVFVPPRVVPRTEYRTAPRTAAPTAARTEYQSSLARGDTPQTYPSESQYVVAKPSVSEDRTDETKAAAKLRVTRQLIGQAKTSAAIKGLQDIDKDFPDTLAADEARRLLDELDPSHPERLAKVLIDVTTLDDDKEEGVFSVELFQGNTSLFSHEYGDGQKWHDNTRKSFTESIDVPINDGEIQLITKLEAKSPQRNITWIAKVHVTVETNRKRRLEWSGGAKFEIDRQKPSYSFVMGTKRLPNQ